MHREQTVFIIDDDDAIRDALSSLLKTVGIQHRSYSSAKDFLGTLDDKDTGCIISDIRMPGMSGLELQQALIGQGVALPIIFITGHADVNMAVEAMKDGAQDFICKPFREQELLDRINQALQFDLSNRQRTQLLIQAQRKINSLSDREKQVLEKISTGKANKLVARELGISERTVEVHRSSLMKKMNASSFAELLQMKLIADEAIV